MGRISIWGKSFFSGHHLVLKEHNLTFSLFDQQQTALTNQCDGGDLRGTDLKPWIKSLSAPPTNIYGPILWQMVTVLIDQCQSPLARHAYRRSPHITSVHHQYPKRHCCWQQITIPQTTTNTYHDPGATQSSKQSATEVGHTQVRQQGQVMVLMWLQGKHSRQPAWKQLKALGRAVPEILLTVGQYYSEVKKEVSVFTAFFLSPCLGEKLSADTAHSCAPGGKEN